MNHEEMSDFQINSAVAENVLWNIRDCEEIYCNDKTGICSWADGANWHEFDPCNNPSDAWPIILARKITIFSPNDTHDDSLWMAELDEFHMFSVNPLRAAMIVFLMMQEASK